MRDAISDLEDVKPVVDLEDDKEGIALQPKENLGELASSLRDSEILKNHIAVSYTHLDVYKRQDTYKSRLNTPLNGTLVTRRSNRKTW